MALAAAALAGCGGDGGEAEPLAYAELGGRRLVTVEDAYVRPVAAGAASSAGYATIVSETDDALVAASSPAFTDVELHEVTRADGISRMRRVETIVLPAGERVELRPGGYHLMMMNPKGAVVEGETVPVTFTFANAIILTVDVPVRDEQTNRDHAEH